MNQKEFKPISILKCIAFDDINCVINHYEVLFKDVDFGYSYNDELKVKEIINNVKNGWSLTRSFGKNYNTDQSKRIRKHPFYILIMRFSQRIKLIKSKRVETNQLLRMRFK